MIKLGGWVKGGNGRKVVQAALEDQMRTRN